MSNHDRSNHDRRIMSENPGVYIAMKSAVLFIQNVSMSLLQANLLVEAFFKTLAYFSTRFQDIRCCFLADIPQKVDNIHLAICFVCLTFLSFIFSQKSAFRLWIAVNTIF